MARIRSSSGMPIEKLARLSTQARHVIPVLLVAGCTGIIGTAGDGATASAPGKAATGGAGTGGATEDGGATATSTQCPAGGPGAQPAANLARLTALQYANSIKALFPSVDPSALSLPQETLIDGYDDLSEAQASSALLVQDLEANATSVAAAAVANLDALVGCSYSTPADAATCGSSFISTFLASAFSRPPTSAEVQRYNGLFSSVLSQIDFPDAIEAVISATLQSPQFVYRIELGQGSPSPNLALTPYELARRVSYFLTNSPPDAPLLQVASDGTLSQSSVLEAQVRRLLATPAARAATTAFHSQWLNLPTLEVNIASKSTSAYPNFTPAAATSLGDGLQQFIDWAVWEGGGIPALLTANKAFVDANTASIYGVPVPDGGASTLVDLPADTRGAGLFTQAGWLAGMAHQAEDAPVLRGVFLLDRVFCEPPPDPPAGVNTAIPPFDPNNPLTTRQVLEQTHSQGSCAGCHNQIDGIGFAFENYGAIGEYRTTDNGLPVNATTQLVGDPSYAGTVTGPEQLAASVTKSDKFGACLTQQWFRYALGRGEVTGDGCYLGPIADKVNATGGDIRELLVAVTLSDAFRTRAPITD